MTLEDQQCLKAHLKQAENLLGSGQPNEVINFLKT